MRLRTGFTCLRLLGWLVRLRLPGGPVRLRLPGGPAYLYMTSIEADTNRLHPATPTIAVEAVYSVNEPQMRIRNNTRCRT